MRLSTGTLPSTRVVTGKMKDLKLSTPKDGSQPL